MISRTRSQVPVMFVVVAVGAVLLGGCLQRKLKPLNPCLVSGVVAEIAVTNIDKIDMLFMVDNSNSMKEEQAKLRSQFGPLITTLTTGVKSDGTTFPPAHDLRLGVVSSDMGLPGVQKVEKCNGLGQDGQLLHSRTTDANVQGCVDTYPQFLSFNSDPGRGTPNAADTATAFQCIATLGTDGCGFEQQLESPLKALWPFDDSRIQFLIDPATGAGAQGHGGQVMGADLLPGDNGGFLRNDPVMGLSLIAIIVVTDEEDCSSNSVEHFIPKQFLDPNDARYGEPLNLRCFYHKDELYPVTRYIDGFKALRPENPNLVIFAAITGVPPDLVDKDKLAKVDLTKGADRDAFYANILSDTRMQEMVDPSSMMTPGQGNLLPSCSTTDNGVPNGKAYPPVRIVQVAQGFGANGLVQSICQDDFGPALDAIIAIIARQLGAVCLPRPLVRASDGKVGCNVVWELPPADGPHGPDTPTQCGAPGFEFLIKPDADLEQETNSGGAICTVAQLAVKTDAMGVRQAIPTDTKGIVYSQGWYYDDFSAELKKTCTGMSTENQQRIAFEGNMGKPPTGVTVKLECLNETQSLANTRTDIPAGTDQPQIGDPCDMIVRGGTAVPRDKACNVQLTKPSAKFKDGVDTSMICHPELNVCVLTCSTTADCPPAWVCDTRDETKKDSGGKSICTNPTCGT